MKIFKKTKIICTIGPKSQSKEVIKKFIDKGMNVVRLNFSHGDYESHKKVIKIINELKNITKKSIGIILDTKGPEIRTKKFLNENTKLEKGKEFIIYNREVIGSEKGCSVTYKNLYKYLKKGERLLINDGALEFKVKTIKDEDIYLEILNSGYISSEKGVNIPDLEIEIPSITDKDRDDIRFGIENDVDFIAMSFVKTPQDILDMRKFLKEEGGGNIKIISKIENKKALENLDEIIDVSDGIMVARGDLGVEINEEYVPLVQKEIIKKCNYKSKFVITATEMLNSMIKNNRPTRAEVTDVANAIFDGTDAIMLSGETAMGNYPVESVEIMNKIAIATEKSIDYSLMETKKKDLNNYDGYDTTNAIAHAAKNISSDLSVKAIITLTSKGFTAKIMSSYKPKPIIIASTYNRKVFNQMSILFGVIPILNESFKEFNEEVIEEIVNILKSENYVKKNDRIILTMGLPLGISKSTNLIRVIEIK